VDKLSTSPHERGSCIAHCHYRDKSAWHLCWSVVWLVKVMRGRAVWSCLIRYNVSVSNQSQKGQPLDLRGNSSCHFCKSLTRGANVIYIKTLTGLVISVNRVLNIKRVSESAKYQRWLYASCDHFSKVSRGEWETLAAKSDCARFTNYA